MSETKAHEGKVKFFDETKGFGFIKESETETEYFVHVSGVNESTLNENDEVSFDLVEGKKGMNCVNVSLI
jgi:CspA family cold shock protein